MSRRTGSGSAARAGASKLDGVSGGGDPTGTTGFTASELCPKSNPTNTTDAGASAMTLDLLDAQPLGRGCSYRRTFHEAVGIDRECITALDAAEEIHNAVMIDGARGIGAPQLLAAHRIGRGRQLDLVAVAEADPTVVQ